MEKSAEHFHRTMKGLAEALNELDDGA